MDYALNPAARLADPLTWFVRAARPLVATPPARAIDTVRVLQRGGLVPIEQPLGQEIWCVQGSLWITHDGDTKDHVISAGQGYVADRSSRMLVCAMDDARFWVRAA